MWRVDSHDFANAESRNDERIERFYFCKKQSEAKTFIWLRYARILFFGYFATLRSAQYDEILQIRA